VTALNVAAGRIFFRSRNAIFPILLFLFLVTARPTHPFSPPILDKSLVAGGVALVFLGELVRLVTIGFDYIDRGGKKGRPAASRLVIGGIYAHTRNPMYLGNIFIATGLSLVSSCPLAVVVVTLLFIFVYQAITCAEEEFLRREYGAEYEAYCAQVPRFFPNPRGLWSTLAQGRYNWRRPFRQDLSTFTWLGMVLAAIPLWRAYFLKGAETAWRRAPGTLWLEASILVLYGLLVFCKKRKWLFYPVKSSGGTD